MTDEELAAIREREQRASSGPWIADEDSCIIDDEGSLLFEGESRNMPNTAAFVAHARTDVPALLAEVDRLRAENAAMRAIVEAVANADPVGVAAREWSETPGWLAVPLDVALVAKARELLAKDE